jgi:hypothetical protein
VVKAPTYHINLSWEYDLDTKTLTIKVITKKDSTLTDPSSSEVVVTSQNFSFEGNPDKKGYVFVTINKSGNYTIKATYMNATAKDAAEIILPKASSQSEGSEGEFVVNVNKPSIIIEAPSDAYVGEPLTIYVTYTNRTPATNIEITVNSEGHSWEIKTDNEGKVTFTPPSPGTYTYSSNLPIKRTSITEVRSKVEHREKKTYQKAVDINVESKAVVYVKPKVNGTYTAKIYLGNKLVMEREAKGTLTLNNLPEGKYHVVVVSHNNVKAIDVEVARTEQLTNLSSFVIAGIILSVLAIIAAIFVLSRRKRKEEPNPSAQQM